MLRSRSDVYKRQDVALAGGLSGTLVCLVELGNVGFDGQLDSVVHLGGQHLILGVRLGKCIVCLLYTSGQCERHRAGPECRPRFQCAARHHRDHYLWIRESIL